MFFDELTAKYIEEHEGEDVRALALRKAPAGVDVQWALRQIAARQTMRKKVPLWAENGGVVYPRQLSVEQCSSQRTAEFKAEIAGQMACGRRFRFVDLTGGMGGGLLLYVGRSVERGVCGAGQGALRYRGAQFRCARA